MKVISKHLLLIVCFVMIGCTIHYGQLVEPEKEVKPTITETEIVVTDNATTEKLPNKWKPGKKHFWVSMLFTQMSQMPQVRSTFLPWHLYQVVECAVGIYEQRYDLEYFEKTFGNTTSKLSPENAAIAYQITYGCTEKQRIIQQQELFEAQKQVDAEDAI